MHEGTSKDASSSPAHIRMPGGVSTEYGSITIVSAGQGYSLQDIFSFKDIPKLSEEFLKSPWAPKGNRLMAVIRDVARGQ